MILQVSPRTIVEAFLPFAGSVPLALVYDAANEVDVGDQPLRLAIRRLSAAGDVVQTGRGRSGALRLTEEGRRRLHSDRQALTLAQAQDAGLAQWDGRWRLTAVSIPEQHRNIRDSIRRRLTALGAATVSTGLYVSPHDLRDGIPADARPWLATATTEDLDLHGLTDPKELAEALWPAHPIVATYRAVDAALRARVRDPGMPDAARRLYLAQAYEDAMRDDPLLPVELRHDSWEPTAIRRTWAQMWTTTSTEEAERIYRGWMDSNDERGSQAHDAAGSSAGRA